MSNSMSRRQFVMASTALSTLAIRSLDSHAQSSVAGNLPKGSCGSKTAEEVTAGLDLSGKTALLTGCSSGIGYETLRVLALRGAHVYGLAPSLEKAKQACAAVSVTGIKGNATPFECEHTDFASVAGCADAVRARDVPLDMLICNAGVYGVKSLELVHGVEKQFAINHLAHFILVNRLLDRVVAARQGRIVVVGSNRDRKLPEVGIEFDNLSGQRYYDMRMMYGQSKLANALFVRQLAKRLSGTHATANVLNPGGVKTKRAIEHARTNYGIDISKATGVKTVEEGAATTCYVATSPALEHVSGSFFEDCNVVPPGDHMQDDALAEKLWAVSEQLTRPYLSKKSV